MTIKAASSGRIATIDAALVEGRIVAAFDPAAIAAKVMDEKKIVVLKSVFPETLLSELRDAVIAWGREIEPAPIDDFRGNYHRRRAMVSRLQQAPHVFHDYNFNAMPDLPASLADKLYGLFEPLRQLYNALTSNDVEFAIPDSGPYPHPQILHYPNGGGFFGRHWHNLVPQRLGFIVVLSEHGRHFTRGATVFDIDGDIVDMEGQQRRGDICIWRYDHHHWVSQSDLGCKFDWNAVDGRWVATFAYFDPAG
jgi:hypothetical protein